MRIPEDVGHCHVGESFNRIWLLLLPTAHVFIITVSVLIPGSTLGFCQPRCTAERAAGRCCERGLLWGAALLEPRAGARPREGGGGRHGRGFDLDEDLAGGKQPAVDGLLTINIGGTKGCRRQAKAEANAKGVDSLSKVVPAAVVVLVEFLDDGLIRPQPGHGRIPGEIAGAGGLVVTVAVIQAEVVITIIRVKGVVTVTVIRVEGIVAVTVIGTNSVGKVVVGAAQLTKEGDRGLTGEVLLFKPGRQSNRWGSDSTRGQNPLPAGLAPDVFPAMGLLHVLLAVGLALRMVRARGEQAREAPRVLGVLVVDVALQLLGGWPAPVDVQAPRDVALVGAGVRLFMLVQVAHAAERLCARAAPVQHTRRGGLVGHDEAVETVEAVEVVEDSRGTGGLDWLTTY